MLMEKSLNLSKFKIGKFILVKKSMSYPDMPSACEGVYIMPQSFQVVKHGVLKCKNVLTSS